MLVGLVIGLILGVAAAVGVVVFLNGAKTPFTNLAKVDNSSPFKPNASAGNEELLAPGTRIKDVQSSGTQGGEAALPALGVPPKTAPKENASEPKSGEDGDSTRFDFYKMLPGQSNNGAETPAKPNIPAKSTTEKNAANVTSPAKSPKLYLQFGAFQDRNEADNLKAKLALIGVEVTIQTATTANQDTVYKVRSGAYDRPEEVQKIRSMLKQEGINSLLLKKEN